MRISQVVEPAPFEGPGGQVRRLGEGRRYEKKEAETSDPEHGDSFRQTFPVRIAAAEIRGTLARHGKALPRLRRRRASLLAAAFAGAAAGVKYLGLFFAAAVFVDLAFTRRKPSAPILFALAAFAVLAPTHVRIAVHTGNPIFPYLPGIFGSTAWDPIVRKPMAEVIIPETLIRFIRLPWDVVFHRSAVGQQPPFSPFYLLGLPLLLVGGSQVRRLAAIPLVWGGVFLFLPPDSRYLVPILPPLSLALAGSIPVSIRIEKRSLLAAL